MSVYNDGIAFLNSVLGKRVDRATATLPQTAAAAIFTIAGGRVALLGILGEVTTIIQNQANNTKLTANPTTGASLDICAVTDIANDAVGSLYSITGTFSDALAGGVPGSVALQSVPLIIPVGTIDLDCAASNTGSVKWSALYVPIDDGAYLEAA